MMTVSVEPVTRPNNRPIIVEETGVATIYEATKTISCGNVEWRVHWQSEGGDRQIRGRVEVEMGGQNRSLSEVQAQVFASFKSVDDVSATCNRGVGAQSVRTALLILGTDVNNRRALAQVYLEANLETSISFNNTD